MKTSRDLMFRELQAHAKRIKRRVFIPTQNSFGERVMQAVRGDEPAYELSDRAYVKRNIKNKVHKYIGHDGKEKFLGYQTCTYVRI